jgi:bacterial/archaeal transporter family-2 protein
MFEFVLTILIGMLGGVAVGTQAAVAGQMSRRVGGAATSFIVHLSGTILSGVVLVARGGEHIKDWRKLPWYMLAAGGFGVLLYLTLSRTIPRLGATTALVLLLVGQLLTGMLLDHFGLFGLVTRTLDGRRIVAACLLLAGAYLVAR